MGIILFFVFKPSLFSQVSSTSNPEGFVEKCFRDSITKTEELLLKNNLKINQNFNNSFLYKSEKVPFLCTVSEFYVPCMPQESTLFISIKKTLENRLLRDMDECFSKMETDLRSAGYAVSTSNLVLNLSLVEDSITVSLNKKITATKGETSISLEAFEFSQPSVLYNLIKTTQTIVNYESTLCEFNEMNWMRNIPQITINKFVGTDGTKVYTLTDRISEKKTKFAVRTCILPAGI